MSFQDLQYDAPLLGKHKSTASEMHDGSNRSTDFSKPRRSDGKDIRSSWKSSEEPPKKDRKDKSHAVIAEKPPRNSADPSSAKPSEECKGRENDCTASVVAEKPARMAGDSSSKHSEEGKKRAKESSTAAVVAEKPARTTSDPPSTKPSEECKGSAKESSTAAAVAEKPARTTSDPPSTKPSEECKGSAKESSTAAAVAEKPSRTTSDPPSTKPSEECKGSAKESSTAAAVAEKPSRTTSDPPSTKPSEECKGSAKDSSTAAVVAEKPSRITSDPPSTKPSEECKGSAKDSSTVAAVAEKPSRTTSAAAADSPSTEPSEERDGATEKPQKTQGQGASEQTIASVDASGIDAPGECCEPGAETDAVVGISKTEDGLAIETSLAHERPVNDDVSPSGVVVYMDAGETLVSRVFACDVVSASPVINDNKVIKDDDVENVIGHLRNLPSLTFDAIDIIANLNKQKNDAIAELANMTADRDRNHKRKRELEDENNQLREQKACFDKEREGDKIAIRRFRAELDMMQGKLLKLRHENNGISNRQTLEVHNTDEQACK